MGKEKASINIVVIGHVGSGKSTTISHLIHKLGGLDKHVIERLEKEAAEMVAGRGSAINIDDGMWELETDKHHFTFIDAHGHAEFIKNMILDASWPDCALLVVDSTSTGGFDVSILGNGQTPEHALIKPPNVICCCNKMDAADYLKEKYDEIVKSTLAHLKKFGYDLAKIRFVPISGLEGDNLNERSNNLPWYEGPTLLEALNQIQVPNGGKTIKSAVMKRRKKLGAAIVKGCKKFGPPCLNACAVGGVQAAVALATN